MGSSKPPTQTQTQKFSKPKQWTYQTYIPEESFQRALAMSRDYGNMAAQNLAALNAQSDVRRAYSQALGDKIYAASLPTGDRYIQQTTGDDGSGLRNLSSFMQDQSNIKMGEYQDALAKAQATPFNFSPSFSADTEEKLKEIGKLPPISAYKLAVNAANKPSGTTPTT